MKVVIDIPEELFNIAKDGMLNDIQSMFICGSVSQGTPLPKGHGRLVDIGKFEKKQKYADPWKLTRKVGQVVRGWENVELSELPTIIEADKTESEK